MDFFTVVGWLAIDYFPIVLEMANLPTPSEKQIYYNYIKLYCKRSVKYNLT